MLEGMVIRNNCQISNLYEPTSGKRGPNSLPNNKMFDLSKLKAFADDKIKVLKMTIFVSDRTENIVEKGENAGYQHFLLFPRCFHKLSFPEVLKIMIVW